MHEHDHELIMALAEGDLDESAAAAATTAISGCLECVRDLELQRLALSALDDLPDVYLTATESARLHASLRHELGVESPSAAKPLRSIAWGRWLPAAGIAAVFLVAIVSLASLSGGSDDDGADMPMAADASRAATETTAASAEAALPPKDGADSSFNDAADQPSFEEMAGGSTETTAAAETTAAPETIQTAETTTTAGDLSPGAFLLPPRGSVADLRRDALITEVLDDEVLNLSSQVLSDDPVLAECLEANVSADSAGQLGVPENSSPVLLGIVLDDTGEELLLVAYVPEDVDATVFVTQRLVGCEIVTTLF